MKVAKLVASCLGIGYLQKGAGTVAAIFCCAVWWALRMDKLSGAGQGLYIVLLFFAGVGVSSAVEKEWGHDSNRVVIDEWLGMSVALFLVPLTWPNVTAAFVLFRFFDIAKPLFVRRMEAVPRGWGVMLDDLLAGVYSVLLLQAFLKIQSS